MWPSVPNRVVAVNQGGGAARISRVTNQRPVTGSAAASWSILDPPRYRERFAFALALSLYLHGLILLLQFGSAGFGLPWAKQRVLPPTLTVRLAEAPPAPEPAAQPLQLRAARSLELRPRKAAPPQARLSLPRRETRTSVRPSSRRTRSRSAGWTANSAARASPTRAAGASTSTTWRPPA